MCGETLSDVATLERRNGPRRLRADDYDDDDEACRNERTSELDNQLENVAIANALQLEAARRRAVLSGLISSPVPSSKSCSLSVAVLDRFYCSYVTLRCT